MSAEHVRRMRLWVDALRSGRYAQATGALRKGDGYCCLGVGCDVYRETTGSGRWVVDLGIWTFEIDDPSADIESEEAELPETVAEWFMADYDQTDPRMNVPADDDATFGPPSTLSALNDGGTPFSEIADLIERRLIPAVEPLEDVEEVPEP